MTDLVKETQALSATALEQVRHLTEELIAVRTDRDREYNFRMLFQRQALGYEKRYHETRKALIEARILVGELKLDGQQLDGDDLSADEGTET